MHRQGEDAKQTAHAAYMRSRSSRGRQEANDAKADRVEPYKISYNGNIYTRTHVRAAHTHTHTHTHKNTHARACG